MFSDELIYVLKSSAGYAEASMGRSWWQATLVRCDVLQFCHVKTNNKLMATYAYITVLLQVFRYGARALNTSPVIQDNSSIHTDEVPVDFVD